MQNAISTDYLSIDYLELDQWPGPVCSLSGYELILIQAGKGYQIVNETRFMYQPGDVFLLNATDKYRFLVTQRTSLYRLCFSPLYITGLDTAASYSWQSLNRFFSSGTVPATHSEQGNLRALAGILLSEVNSPHHSTSTLIVDSLMKTILGLIDRLLAPRDFADQEGVRVPRPTYSSELTSRVAMYISQHIGEPDRLRMDAIADKFNYSPGHLSALFKQQAGDSIQQFIIRHKLKLVATRLRQTPLTVSQIADEFGFSDVCHLNKLFKRYYKHTPTTYRQVLST